MIWAREARPTWLWGPRSPLASLGKRSLWLGSAVRYPEGGGGGTADNKGEVLRIARDELKKRDARRNWSLFQIPRTTCTRSGVVPLRVF